MNPSTFELKTNDNLNLHARADLVSKPRRNIIIVHGLGEHCGRYDYLTEKLNKDASNVFRFDLRGHGRSEGRSAYIDDFRDYLEDTSQMVRYVKEFAGNEKTFLLGHSMGGYIAASYAVHGDENFDGVILSAAATNTPKEAKGPMRPLLTMLAGLAPKLTLGNDLGVKVSKDPSVVEAYFSDELNKSKICTKLFYQFLIKGIDDLNQNAKAFQYPVLLMHGKEDKIIPYHYSERFSELISSKDKSLIIYPELHHEIFNEPEKDQVIADMLLWLSERS